MVGRKAEASPDKMIFPNSWEAKTLLWCFIVSGVAFPLTKVIIIIINTLLSPSTTAPFNPFFLFNSSVHSFDDSRVSQHTHEELRIHDSPLGRPRVTLVRQTTRPVEHLRQI